MLAQVNFQSLNVSVTHTFVALSASLLASIAVYLMYHLFYGSRTMGAVVNRTFLLGGPAVTALFLGIQSSIPLSLGLLGALSFVRFRTPAAFGRAAFLDRLTQLTKTPRSIWAVKPSPNYS
jgi:hypothetical protein